ncbi:MAG: prepilin-type N-terminal cleavage/methylation domain-containing protein [Patescibacteria group bacterium]
MRKHVLTNQRGFTILELIIASTVFSTIMLLATTGLIQIGRTYHKGQITAKTQEATRGVIEEISREVQFSNNAVQQSVEADYSASLNVVKVRAVCVGNTRYTFVTNQPRAKLAQADDISATSPTLRHLLWADRKLDSDPCVASNLNLANPSNGRELLAQGMRLTNFRVQQAGENVNIDIKIYYGDYDLAGGLASQGTDFCESSKTGGQFCSSSELSTVVRRRI